MNQACRKLARVLPKPCVATSASRSAPSLGFRRFFHQAKTRSPSSSIQQWQKLSSSCGWISLIHPQHEICGTHNFRFFSVASPISEKDSCSYSSVEETVCTSGEEVEPTVEGKAEHAQAVTKEQPAKLEQKDKEARLSSIAKLEALIAEKDAQLVELKERALASPISEKDSCSYSSVEETVCTSGEEVEPTVEGKAEHAQAVTKEQPAKPEQKDKEACLSSIAKLEALIAEKDAQLVELKERALVSRAELENVRLRLQREADNTKKFSIQEFAKSLLDVADNLGRAIMTVPEHIRKGLVTDQSETGKLLKSLLEGVMMTEKELMKVLKKFGVEKFEPVGQQFDPNSHLALFEVTDPSKEPGTVAIVVKVGYMLHDRVLRPAEVGVVKSLE